MPWRITSRTSGESSCQGVEREKWYFLDRASKYIREMPSERIFPQPEAWMAPSRMLSFPSGTMRSGSAFNWLPRPVQAGQAPKGLLKENIRGVSSSMEMPQSSQA